MLKPLALAAWLAALHPAASSVQGHDLSPSEANALRDQFQLGMLNGRPPFAPAAFAPTRDQITNTDMMRIQPFRAISGHAFIDRRGRVYVLAGISSCATNRIVRARDFPSAYPTEGCLAASADKLLGFMSREMMRSADTAINCQIYRTQSGTPPVRYVDCFWREKPDAPPSSVSRAMLAYGWAFAERDPQLRPVSDDFARVEAFARTNQNGLWNDASFPHPYGDAAKRLPASPNP
jgi:hypothetical protein